MNTIRSESAASAPSTGPAGTPLVLLAREPGSSWEARGLTNLVPPATLAEARERRDELARLLGHERAAAADFLLALADFDRRRGWERLGHASLFAFLTRELGLSKGAAYVRFTAARLLPRFPEVEAGLRSGRLCLSAVGELARVLTTENEAEVLPRFFGCSSREAREVAAALRPRPNPPRREVVTAAVPHVPTPAVPASALATALAMASTAHLGPAADTGPAQRSNPTSSAGVLAIPDARPGLQAVAPAAWPGRPEVQVRAHEPATTHPARGRDEVEPLSADLRRLHLTVSACLLEKVARARVGLSRAVPGATTEQVLDAALNLLLEQQARRRSMVKRPRKVPGGSPTPTSARHLASTPTPTPTPTKPTATPVRAPARRPAVPAAIERDVRFRDGDRCQFPVDSGGVCGSSWQVELDHLVPVALGGPTTAANLRCACAFHNRYAAERVLGGPIMEAGRRRRGTRQQLG